MHNCYNMGFHVCGSHCLAHINSYSIACAGFLPLDHLLVLHLEEEGGHCENTVSYPRTQKVIPARGQIGLLNHSATMPPLFLMIEADTILLMGAI